jgi:hypothetical protein
LLLAQHFVQEDSHGVEVRQEDSEEGRRGDARVQARQAEKRVGQKGDEPQAGHRHRALRGAARRRQGAVEEVELEEVVEEGLELEEVEQLEEALVVEEVVLLEEALVV